MGSRVFSFSVFLSIQVICRILISPTRDKSRSHCRGRMESYHWATREVPFSPLNAPHLSMQHLCTHVLPSARTPFHPFARRFLPSFRGAPPALPRGRLPGPPHWQLSRQLAAPVCVDCTEAGQHPGQDTHWVLTLALPRTARATTGKFPAFSGPQFPHL